MLHSYKRRAQERGFTIVELLIVIIVIGILATLVITTFASLKQKDRDNERQNDIKTLHAQVEAYFAQVGKYPTLANLNSTNWRDANMKGLDPEVLRDPQGVAPILAAQPAPHIYSYDVRASDDSACDDVTKDCTNYTLTATYEGGGVFTKTNLN